MNKFGNEFGKGGRFPGQGVMPKDGQRPQCHHLMAEVFRQWMVGGLSLGKGEPNYIAVSLKFNGKTWKKVGFRLKGNSTLMMSWARAL